MSTDNPVRLIDAFIDKLELQQLEFASTVHKSGRRREVSERQTLIYLLLSKEISNDDMILL